MVCRSICIHCSCGSCITQLLFIFVSIWSQLHEIGVKWPWDSEWECSSESYLWPARLRWWWMDGNVWLKFRFDRFVTASDDHLKYRVEHHSKCKCLPDKTRQRPWTVTQHSRNSKLHGYTICMHATTLKCILVVFQWKILILKESKNICWIIKFMKCIVLQETYLCHYLHYIYAALCCIIQYNVYYMNGIKNIDCGLVCWRWINSYSLHTLHYTHQSVVRLKHTCAP